MTTKAEALGRRQLFVYWRFDPSANDEVITTLQRTQQTLMAQQPHLVAAVYRRRHDPDDAGAGTDTTVMESYAVRSAFNTEGLDDELASRIGLAVDAATAAWRRGRRHEEWFELCR